ncbi:MAG: BatA domain-containing protein [Planctomycetes bacterium]|nr:BatA domain-containing protein [Planctomycetota bacterium]
MNFLSLSMLGFAALMPLVVLLYLLKLRRKEQVISSTYLWKRAIEDFRVNAPFQKLRRNLLLFLQLLVLALAVFALMRPYIQGKPEDGESLFVLIDNSASMQATDVSPNRLAEAKRKAKEAVDGMNDSDNMMVIAYSSKASIVASLTRDRMRLKQAIDALEPADTRTNLREAILIAASLAAPPTAVPGADTGPDAPPVPVSPLGNQVNSKRRLVIVSDGRFTDLPDRLPKGLPVSLVTIGEKKPGNLAITALDARKSLDAVGDFQVYARVENFGKEKAEATLELYLNDKMIDAAPVELGPGKSVSRVFDKQGLKKGVLRVRLDLDDDLAVDNTAWTIIGAEQTIDLLLVSENNFFLEKALALDPRTSVSKITPEAFAKDERAHLEGALAYDFFVFDRCAPKSLPPGNYLFLAAVPPLPEVALGDEVKEPIVVDWNHTHPTTRFADFGNVSIGKSRALRVPSWAVSLLESDRGPLIAALTKENLQVGIVAFDIFASDWPIRLSFPMFISNVVEWLGGGGSQITSATRSPGDVVTIYPDRGMEQVTVTDPSGRKQEFKVGQDKSIGYAATERVGLYSVLCTGKKEAKAELRFAVNLLNAEESNIVPRENVKFGSEAVVTSAAVALTNQELWRWFAIGAFAVLLLEWIVYHRRVGM